MAKPSGPTVARWILGEELAKLREAANLGQGEVAAQLGSSISKVQRIEYGSNSASRPDLIVLLDLYGVTDEATRAHLFDLREQGRQRGWWVKYGRVPKLFADFLGVELAASTLRIYEPMMVTGLLQTEDYARALAQTSDGPLPSLEVERQVRLRMERQARILDDDPPEIWMILDESVLRRAVGGPKVMAAQLRHLGEVAQQGRASIQIMPFNQGAHTGMRGSLTVFEFPGDIHSPIGYAESNAGGIYLEDEHDQHRCTVMWQNLTAAAASLESSARMVMDAMRQFEELAKE